MPLFPLFLRFRAWPRQRRAPNSHHCRQTGLSVIPLPFNFLAKAYTDVGQPQATCGSDKSTFQNHAGDLSLCSEKMPSVFIKTYGCQMNERDSEAVAAQLVAKGYSIAPAEN